MRWIAWACLAALLVGCDATESSSTAPERGSSSSADGTDRVREGDKDAFTDPVRNGRIVSAEPVRRPPASWCPDCDFDRPRDRAGDVALYLRRAGTQRSGSTWTDGIAVMGPRGALLQISCPDDFPCLEGGSAPRAEDLAQVDWQFPGWGPVALGPGEDELSIVSQRDRVDIRSFDGPVRRTVTLRGIDEDERVLDLAWSPDRSLLAVATGHARVWIFDADGRRGQVAYTSRATTGPRYLGDLAWSPAGDAIGFLESYEFNPSVYLVIAAADRGKPRQVYWWPSGRDGDQVYVWSPDGTRVAVDDGRRLLELSTEDGRILARHRRVPDPIWLARSR